MTSLGHPCKFQLVSRLGSITARHASSGRQPNFAALNRGRHLYSAGRPSRWALAHISSYLCSVVHVDYGASLVVRCEQRNTTRRVVRHYSACARKLLLSHQLQPHHLRQSLRDVVARQRRMFHATNHPRPTRRRRRRVN